jgi:hypothetical protein
MKSIILILQILILNLIFGIPTTVIDEIKFMSSTEVEF